MQSITPIVTDNNDIEYSEPAQSTVTQDTNKKSKKNRKKKSPSINDCLDRNAKIATQEEEKRDYIAESIRKNSDNAANKAANYAKKKERLEEINHAVKTKKTRNREVGEEKEALQEDLRDADINFGSDDLLRAGVDLLSRRGVEVRYDPNSKFGGLALSKEENLKIPGLSLKGLKYKKFINHLGGDFDIFKWVESHIFKEWETCIYGNNPKCKVSNAARNTDILSREKSTSLRGDGKRVSDRMIPGKDFFPESFQKLTFSDLLPIFNEPELKTFVGHLGRICAGSSYSERDYLESRIGNGLVVDDILYPTEKGAISHRISHKYRYIVVINGAPKVGKSTLLEIIDRVLYMCGYRSHTIPRSNNQFGWGAALSDHMFASDMSIKDIVEIQTSSQIKEIASGDYFNFEKKGVDGIMRRALAAITLLCNEVQYPKNFDRGVQNRFHFLQTKSTEQLSLQTGCSNLGLYWENLAEKMSTTVDALVAYLLRSSLDYYLENIGYVWDEENERYNYDKNVAYSYDKIIEQNQKGYALQAPKDLTAVLTKAARKTLVLSQLAGKKIPHQFDYGFGLHSLLHFSNTLSHINTLTAKYHDKGDGKKVEFFREVKNWLLPEKTFYDNTWSKFNQSVKDDVISSPHCDGLERWNKFITKLSTTSGRIPPENLERYDSMFRYQKTQTDTYEQEFKEMCDKYNIKYEVAYVWLGLDIDATV